MKVRWIGVLVALSGCAPLRDGTAAWEAGDAAEAVSQWSSAGGQPSAAVHYNLGVAAYRADRVPLALAHWRAARRLKPRDGDIVHNLAHARGDLSGTTAPVGEPLSWMEFATPVELGLVGTLCLAWASFGLVRRRRRDGPVAGWLIVGGTGLFLGGAAVQGASAWSHEPVVVLTAEVVLRDAPDAAARELGTIGSGSELWLADAVGPWMRVSNGADREGWVPAEAGLVAGPVPVGSARVVGLQDVAVPVAGSEPAKP